MNKILVDTSIWIDFFRVGEGAIFDFLEKVIEEGRIVTCGVVLAELLRGTKSKKEGRLIEELFSAVPSIDLTREDWEKAGWLLAEAQTKGVTVPLTDGLLVQACRRHQLDILSHDKHFTFFPDLNVLQPSDFR